MKRIIAVLAAAVLMLTACSSATLDGVKKELEDAIADISDSENRYVRMVKGGYRANQPELTYGDAFDSFFGSPRWKYFKGEDGQDVVEFTGDCMYQKVSVKARLQFIVDEENGTFETGYLAFNEVPQNALILAALIQAVFENAEEAGISNSNGNTGAVHPGNGEDAGAEDLCYKGVFLPGLLHKSAEYVRNVIGFPTFGTPVDGEMLFGGTEYYGYDGLVLYFDSEMATVMQIYVQPDFVKMNGRTLDTTRPELIRFLGQPEYEGYDGGIEGEADPYYYMQYDMSGAGYWIEIDMPDENSKATGIIIYEYEESWGW